MQIADVPGLKIAASVQHNQIEISIQSTSRAADALTPIYASEARRMVVEQLLDFSY